MTSSNIPLFTMNTLLLSLAIRIALLRFISVAPLHAALVRLLGTCSWDEGR